MPLIYTTLIYTPRFGGLNFLFYFFENGFQSAGLQYKYNYNSLPILSPYKLQNFHFCRSLWTWIVTTWLSVREKWRKNALKCLYETRKTFFLIFKTNFLWNLRNVFPSYEISHN